MLTDAPTVLVVDDDEAIREVLRDLLEDDGYHVVLARNGRECIAKSTQGVSAILMDVMMPGMDGFTTCRQLSICRNTCNIPVLFLSGFCTDQTPQAAYRMGAVDFLQKPVRASELRAKLGAATQLDPHAPPEHRRAHYRELVCQAVRQQADEEAAAHSLLDCAHLSGMT
jgi:CheY-like chemotaxis protein